MKIPNLHVLPLTVGGIVAVGMDWAIGSGNGFAGDCSVKE